MGRRAGAFIGVQVLLAAGAAFFGWKVLDWNPFLTGFAALLMGFLVGVPLLILSRSDEMRRDR